MSLVPIHALYSVWDIHVVPLLEKAIKHNNGRFDIIDVYRELLGDTAQLWVVMDENTDEIVAAMTTKIIPFPRKKILSGILCGGTRLSEWMEEAMEIFDRFGKENDCSGFQVAGRRGWIGALKKLGMTETFVTVEKDYG